MPPDNKTERDMLHELILENQKLLTENNQLLNKLNNRSLLSFWFRLITFLILIGAPFVLYFYIVEPYFTSLGSSFQTFQDGLQEVPGWKQFYEAVGGDVEGGE